MKYQTHKNEKRWITNFSSRGGEVDEFVTLPETVVSVDDAVRKDHTDLTFNNLSAQNLVKGVINGTSIAGLISGDFEAFSINNVRINHRMTQGSYAGVTVNSKGLVSDTYSLVSDDVPPLDLSKFTSKPTTAGGYGITDAILNTGGSINGNITLAVKEPTSANQVSTKYYADIKITVFSAPYLKPGDLIYKVDTGNYIGYLRCNGAIVSKTTYSKLYAAIGESYSYDAENFKLPDLTSLVNNGYGYFIKT